MIYTKTTYQDLIDETKIIDKQISSLGLTDKNKKCRFFTYLNIIDATHKAVETGQLSQYLTIHNQKGEIIHAIRQLSELNYIFRLLLPISSYMNAQDKQFMFSRMSQILSGPVFIREENARNSSARNYQFELLIAAEMVDKGYTHVRLKNHPDVLVNAYGRLYPIECKRVVGDSDRSVIHAIDEAIDQLNDYPTPNSIGGIIALDFSRLYEWPNNILEGRSLKSANDFTQNILENNLKALSIRAQSIVKANREKKLLGMIGGISAGYVIPSTNQFGWIHEMALYAYTAENPVGTKIFMRDFTKLRKSL